MTTKDPGPVTGALGPVAGRVKLIDVLLVGVTGNGPTAARTGAEQVHGRSGGAESRPVQGHYLARYHQCLDVVAGISWVATGGCQGVAVDARYGRNASLGIGLEQGWSRMTQVARVGVDHLHGDKSIAQTQQRGKCGRTPTVSWVGRERAIGVNGPVFIRPAAVATNRLTSEPAVKFSPVMLNSSPVRIVPGDGRDKWSRCLELVRSDVAWSGGAVGGIGPRLSALVILELMRRRSLIGARRKRDRVDRRAGRLQRDGFSRPAIGLQALGIEQRIDAVT